MLTLIVGLGNPGSEYTHTRHNIGFLALDHMRETFSAPEFHPELKFSAELSSVVIHGHRVILAKPMTSMNESGRAVRAILDYYKLDMGALTVIHDDLDLTPGTLRTTDSSRAAGHNGVQDIIDCLGTQDFFRIRLGIGRPAEVEGVCRRSHDYVLSHFSAAESAGHPALFDAVTEAIRKRLGA